MRNLKSLMRRALVPPIFLAAFGAMYIVALSSSPLLAQTPFVPRTVDVAAVSGTSTAIDASGDAHIAYLVTLGADAYEVWYARQSGAVWTTEMIASVKHQPSSSAAGFPSLAVEANGTPHVVYKNTPGWPPLVATDVIHAEKVGAVWVTTTIDDIGGTGGYASVALDPMGLAHVSYYNSLAGGELYYAAETGGFVPELVSSGAAGTSNSIAIADPLGERAHVSFFDGADLYYAARSIGGTWTLTLVDAALGAAAGGAGTSIALDAQGFAHISYLDATGGIASYDLFYATNVTGAWVSGVVDAAATGSPGIFSDIAIDAEGEPHISYNGFLSFGLRYATATAGVWAIERISYTGIAGTSLALDIHGNPQVSHGGTGELVFSDTAVHLVSPAGGETWPVGSERTIEWRGQGPVNLNLSVDGGNTYDQIATGLSSVAGGSYTLRVPHTPSRFCVVKVERLAPFSEEECDSFFTIETSIALLSLVVNLDGQRGAVVSWNTDPGPPDLGGYRLEKQRSGGVWPTLVKFTRETSYNDDDGSSGDRYRLYAVNGLGEEFYMGETGTSPRFTERLSLWPVPYSSGDLHVSFATASGLGGGSAHAEVAVYDVGGRLVKKIVSGPYPAGVHTAVWDGQNEQGRRLAAGVYFVRATSGGEQLTRKLVIVR